MPRHMDMPHPSVSSILRHQPRSIFLTQPSPSNQMGHYLLPSTPNPLPRTNTSTTSRTMSATSPTRSQSRNSCASAASAHLNRTMITTLISLSTFLSNEVTETVNSGRCKRTSNAWIETHYLHPNHQQQRNELHSLSPTTTSFQALPRYYVDHTNACLQNTRTLPKSFLNHHWLHIVVRPTSKTRSFEPTITAVPASVYPQQTSRHVHNRPSNRT